MYLESDIRTLGGLAPAHLLLSMGWTYRTLSYAAQHGWVTRVRQGWYAINDVDALLASAWRVGGWATCVTGAASHSLWVPPDDRLHVVVPPNHARLRSRDDMRVRLAEAPDDGVVVHWRTASAHDRLRATPLECVIDLAACHEPAWVLGALDSGLRRGTFTRAKLRTLLGVLPASWGWVIELADGRSESFPESVLRCRLAAAGIPFQIQVWIDDMRVDFLLGKLVIEVDGKEHHSDPTTFERDRVRDARLSIRGYRVLRFSYAQVVYRPDEVLASIRAALARGDHR